TTARTRRTAAESLRPREERDLDSRVPGESYERVIHHTDGIIGARPWAALVVAAALSACSSSSKPPSSATSTLPTNTTAPTRSVPGSLNELASRIVTSVPAGFIAQPDRVGDTGP